MTEEQIVASQEPISLKRYTAAFAPYTLTILRVLVGFTFLMHGLPKIPGLGAFSAYLPTIGVPLPSFFAVIVAALEVGGGLLLIAGFATRWVSIFYVIEMIVTILRVKLPNVGFIAPTNLGAGAELDLLLLACALVLLAHGSGPLSVEHNLLEYEL